jgi:hypothetical protein
LTEGDRRYAAIESLAAELDRIAHEAPTPSVEDSCENIALIVRAMNSLCRNSVQALAQIALAMLEHAGCETIADNATREVH